MLYKAYSNESPLKFLNPLFQFSQFSSVNNNLDSMQVRLFLSFCYLFSCFFYVLGIVPSFCIIPNSLILVFLVCLSIIMLFFQSSTKKLSFGFLVASYTKYILSSLPFPTLVNFQGDICPKPVPPHPKLFSPTPRPVRSPPP